MLKKNEVCEVTVAGYTSEGHGVARIDGQAIFIPGGIEGERCRIRIEKVLKNFAIGKIMELTEPSPHRVRPTCKYAGECGGCAFLHMDYDEELRLKAARVRDALNRIGGCSLDSVEITGGSSIFGYRNKAQYPVAACGGIAEAGFYREKSHELIPISRCRIQNAAAEEVRRTVVGWMRENRIPAYSEEDGSGLIRHVYVRTGAVSGQVLACIVAATEKLPGERELVASLKAAVPGLTSVVLSVHKEKGNAVLGREFRNLYGPGTIEDTLCGLTFRLSPQSFYQVNHDQAERLYACALRLAGLSGKERVLDLYCGTGTITLCLAKEAGEAIGVEIVESAIRDAKENAERNGISNARFFCADAGEAAKRLAEEGTRPDVIVVDPPRKGLSPDVIDAMLTMDPERIVYVSCDPATLARDVKLLSDHYSLVHAEAYDMFPRCAHVETACLMMRKSTTHHMKLNPQPFEMIKSGRKTIELRLFNEKRQKIKAGDSIVFTETVTGEKLNAKAEKMHRFESFDELYKSLPLLKCGYTEKTIADAKPSDMEEYYSAEEQKKYGVVGIEISQPNADETAIQSDRKSSDAYVSIKTGK